jgi:hypothetical protein
MSHDTLDDRRRALEDSFFQKQNDALTQKLKDSAAKTNTREELIRLTGISDEGVLSALANLNMGSAATLVMSMFPMIDVAWADGSIDAAEKQLILEFAAKNGVAAGTEANTFLTTWLDGKPGLEWAPLWHDYTKALCAKLNPDDKILLKTTVLGRARQVAEASGGFLGIAFQVSAAESKILERLALAFE